MLSDLPKACEVVLNASSPSLAKATHKIRAVNFDAPQLDIPTFSASAVINSKPIEANKSSKKSANNEIDISLIPVPLLKPVRR